MERIRQNDPSTLCIVLVTNFRPENVNDDAFL